MGTGLKRARVCGGVISSLFTVHGVRALTKEPSSLYDGFAVHNLRLSANLRSVRRHLFHLNRLLISSISVRLIMTENQVKVPVDSCYQVKCDKCGKTTWKVNSFFQCALIITIDHRPAYFIRAVECMSSR